jgi:TonB family protein
MLSASRAVCLLIVALTVAACARHQQALKSAHAAIEVGRYDLGRQYLRRAQSLPLLSEKQKVDIAYLKGKSFEGQGNVSDAVTTYQAIDKAFPEHFYGYLARQKLRYLLSDDSEPDAALDLKTKPNQPSAAESIGSTQSSQDGVRANRSIQNYLLQARNKINRWWSFPCVGHFNPARCAVRDAQVDVEISVERDGTVVSMKILATSGTAIYDLYAIEAITLAAPFAPVPDAVSGGMSFPMRWTMRFQYVNNLREGRTSKVD